MELLAIMLMFTTPTILIYIFAARAHARAARAGDDGGEIGYAMRYWAYRQVVPPVALLAMFFWTTVFVVASPDGWRRAPSAPPVERKVVPPPGYTWGPNDSLQRIESSQLAPRRTARTEGKLKRPVDGAEVRAGSVTVSR